MLDEADGPNLITCVLKDEEHFSVQRDERRKGGDIQSIRETQSTTVGFKDVEASASRNESEEERFVIDLRNKIC